MLVKTNKKKVNKKLKTWIIVEQYLDGAWPNNAGKKTIVDYNFRSYYGFILNRLITTGIVWLQDAANAVQRCGEGDVKLIAIIVISDPKKAKLF